MFILAALALVATLFLMLIGIAYLIGKEQHKQLCLRKCRDRFREESLPPLPDYNEATYREELDDAELRNEIVTTHSLIHVHESYSNEDVQELGQLIEEAKTRSGSFNLKLQSFLDGTESRIAEFDRLSTAANESAIHPLASKDSQ